MAKIQDYTCKSPFWKNLHDRYSVADPSNQFRTGAQATAASHASPSFAGCGYHIRKHPQHNGGVSSYSLGPLRQGDLPSGASAEMQRCAHRTGQPHKCAAAAIPEATKCGTPDFGSPPPPKKCPKCCSRCPGSSQHQHSCASTYGSAN